ncbi:MAG: dinitrogenase iron-molybdenum cofactor biosynthesis protein [Nitrospiraceae bacterium]|jgi:predicted Fe-Mo cluster-binding NifX family protein|nr:MAG: dinitrogenase iron-molybdenum cofactor biosynthesis protein [Nitrospiraceae bacterium]
MKLCITSSGRDLDALADERFGRAEFFLIVDTDTLSVEAVMNTAQAAGQGAGIGAAQIIADKGADALLTGVVGPNAFQSLKEAGIIIYEGLSDNDTAREALEKFKKGGYREASAPSGGPGHGRGRGRW